MRLAGVVLLLAGVSMASDAAPGGDAGPHPHPSLAPAEVVRIQVEALRDNDAQDRGIAIAFRFASADNRRSTGPLSRFAAMLKREPYLLLLRHTEALYGPVTVAGRRAAQRVTLIAPGRAPVTFVFHLAREDAAGELQDCWLSDAVQVVESRNRAA